MFILYQRDDNKKSLSRFWLKGSFFPGGFAFSGSLTQSSFYASIYMKYPSYIPIYNVSQTFWLVSRFEYFEINYIYFLPSKYITMMDRGCQIVWYYIYIIYYYIIYYLVSQICLFEICLKCRRKNTCNCYCTISF